jgi:hypothetical protein
LGGASVVKFDSSGHSLEINIMVVKDFGQMKCCDGWIWMVRSIMLRIKEMVSVVEGGP